MSEDPKLAAAEAVVEPASPERERTTGGIPGSLRARGAQRREELEKRTTEIFKVPLYDGILAVELRAIAWAKTEQYIEKNQHISSPMLATAGDEIIAATVGFFEVKENGETLERVEGDPTWETLAKAFGKRLPDPCPPRVALLALCSDQGVVALNGQYRRWLGGENTGLSQVAREIRRDF